MADDRRRDDRLPYGRRRRTAASALVAILVAVAFGALFNAPAMKKTALELPFGGERSFRLAVLDPLTAVSHGLFLDRPARLTAQLLGKPDPGPTAVPAVVVTTPTPQPSRSGAPKPPPGERPVRTPYKGHPMHLYIAGDSMMGLPGMALVNLSNKTRLIKPLLDYKISSGLSRPDFFNWPAQLEAQVREFDAGAVAVMFGANDNQAVQTSSGKVYQFETAGWKKEYRRRVADVIRLLFDSGAKRIYWIGQPIMPDAAYDRQIKVLNEIYRSEVEKVPGVEYIDAYKLLANGSGAYAQYLRDAAGEMQKVREADGEHLTYAGGLRLAGAVIAAIKKEWFAGKPGENAGESSPAAATTSSPAP